MRAALSRNPKRLLMPHLANFTVPLRSALLLLSFGALAGCASTQTGQVASVGGATIDPRYGVKASPRVVAEGEEVPKGGGNFMVGKPYKIAGKTYVPSEKPYSAVGTASWYGSDFHGRRTANGEVFDRQSISAAHPTMPLPSYARVTNTSNSRSMIVRVNDRGPYHGGRVMDVSQRVAEALDFHRAGTAKIKVEWIGRADMDGDDDARLLATLREDVPATLESHPVQTASRGAFGAEQLADLPSRNDPVRTASAETTSADSEALAYAPDEPRSSGKHSAAKAEPVKTESAKLDGAKVGNAKHDAGKAESAKSATAKADIGKHDLGKHDLGKHEISKHDAGKNDAAKHETGKRSASAKADSDDVSTIIKKIGKNAPTPPTRPGRQASAKPLLRQAMN